MAGVSLLRRIIGLVGGGAWFNRGALEALAPF
eukprot:CAMPEP_0171114194 /NCGR_PEP_ID=MMETSP0766_2-20121228/84739_1 /TAXON_ID=439317 /ORGANISM="Gambierdiscus australes, Strain CAWD 149" /LENGTH=31 /DNA_ID= /DNA_START= /DNA_END= /DNA_ORIENTATION=